MLLYHFFFFNFPARYLFYLVIWLYLGLCSQTECFYLLVLCVIREKDVDIAFAQDAIDEYKVLYFSPEVLIEL